VDCGISLALMLVVASEILSFVRHINFSILSCRNSALQTKLVDIVARPSKFKIFSPSWHQLLPHCEYKISNVYCLLRKL